MRLLVRKTGVFFSVWARERASVMSVRYYENAEMNEIDHIISFYFILMNFNALFGSSVYAFRAQTFQINNDYGDRVCYVDFDALICTSCKKNTLWCWILLSSYILFKFFRHFSLHFCVNYVDISWPKLSTAPSNTSTAWTFYPKLCCKYFKSCWTHYK